MNRDCVNSCAYLAVWTPVGERFLGSWKFKDQNKVERIVTDNVGKRAAVLFSNTSDGVSNYSLTVFNWTSESTIKVNSTMYQFSQPFDASVNEFGYTMTFVGDSINLIINSPNKMDVRQYVFNLTGSNITSFQ